MLTKVWVLLLLTSASLSLPWLEPEATNSGTSTANWTPAITGSPRLDLSKLSFRNLLHRKNAFTPNPSSALCGYKEAGGAGLEPVGDCSPGFDCAWNAKYSVKGCCDTAVNACLFYTACADYRNPFEATGDTSNILTCSNTASPICNLQNWNGGGYTAWACFESPRIVDVSTSYAGMEASLPQFITAEELKFISSTSVRPSTTVSSTATQVSSTVETPQSTSVPQQSPPTTQISTVGRSQSTSIPPKSPSTALQSLSPSQTSTNNTASSGIVSPSTPSASSAPGGKGSAVGTIAGSTVGGLFAMVGSLAAIYFGITKQWFAMMRVCFRKNRRNDSNRRRGEPGMRDTGELQVRERQSGRSGPTGNLVAPFTSTIGGPPRGTFNDQGVFIPDQPSGAESLAFPDE